MKTLYAAVAATALLLTARPSLAEDSKIEMTKLTCAQFAQYDKDNAGTIMMWLEGYYTEEDDEVVIDFGKMAGDMAQLLVYCGNNPDKDIITASDEVMGTD